jgi:competence protein ComEA
MTARVIGSRFAKPIARVAVVAASVVVLAVIGRTASPRTLGGSAPAAPSSSAPQASETKSYATVAGAPQGTAGVAPTAPPADPSPQSPSPSRAAASPDDPVVLNAATGDEFLRLPGIGEKRSNAILALRTRLGRFRAIEDLLKVKGIGRATLKRLRPLVRLDPRPSPSDARESALRTPTDGAAKSFHERTNP